MSASSILAMTSLIAPFYRRKLHIVMDPLGVKFEPESEHGMPEPTEIRRRISFADGTGRTSIRLCRGSGRAFRRRSGAQREVNQKSISSRLQFLVVMTSAWMSHGLPSARACFAPG